MEKRLKEVMALVFEIDSSLIDENSSQETVAGWDSLKHMNLITALEEEFNIVFNDDELVELLNYKLIKLIIEQKTKK
jgi:acyl carrier protein